MKRYPEKYPATRNQLLSLALTTVLALPLPAQAASVALATSPLATSTISTVLPNVMFVLDDSGSMDWDYMPDNAKNFNGKYGFNSSQCNGTYYNPAITYTPPVDSTGTSYPNASFSAAWRDGYKTSDGTVNLNTNFTGGSGTGSSGASGYTGPAFYYVYSGTQSTAAQKNYYDTNSVFYKECNSAVGSTTAVDGTHPVNTLFTKTRLAAIPTTTITVAGAGAGGATITINTASSARLGTITVSGAGGGQIMSGRSSSSSNVNTVATNIATKINNCTTVSTGNCTVTGYSATTSGSVITITGPAASSATLSLVMNSGSMSYTTTAFPTVSPTTANSITVGGIQLLSADASGASTTALASDIASKITAAAGYSATVSGSVVTVTGPASASTLTPVINVLSGSMTLTTQPFPESTASKLQNFANWYSYYSTRMLMTKTGAGLAFAPVGDNYRVGFLTMNNNVSPGIVQVAPFDAAQKSLWYTKLYASNPGSSTPLREVLSKTGQYYAHKFGSITTYTATITVGGSGDTSVSGITVNGLQIMNDASAANPSTSVVAANIANQINAVQATEYGATASGNVVTIRGPASSSSHTPNISDDDGGMTFVASSFSASTTTAQLNGITPADPMQYSCQQNFTILSTDGYWNGPNTYDLAGNAVGQQDGTAARPMNDGAHATTTWTITYTRDNYSAIRTEIGGGSNCSSSPSKKRGVSEPQICSCTVTVAGAQCASACTSTSSDWSNNGSKIYLPGYTSSTSTCVSTVTLPSPDPGTRVEQSRVESTGTSGGTSNTLADVAMYYYQTDLRTPLLGNCTGALGESVCDNNVFISSTDNNIQQHMTTFTLGLGTRGRMVYSASYLTDTTGDYVAVKLSSTAHPGATPPVCSWQTDGSVCNWPTPSSGAIENIDDLWHAAVNGRGAYFSATDPTSLSDSLSNALVGITTRKGSAAAAATSTLNPVAGNNFAYVASYTTVTWKGNLEARGINTETGVVSENATWCAENVVADTCPSPGSIVADTTGDTTVYNCVTPNSVVCTNGVLDGMDCKVPVATACTGTMGAMVSSTSDTRTIKTANSTGTALINFDAAYATANPTNFDAAHISGLNQWTTLTAAQKTAAEGVNLVNYLRGQYGYEDRPANAPAVVGDPDNRLYRTRESVLGDALESQPAFISKPVFSYPYPGYSDYVTAQASRAGVVYMGANDGMMHAFYTQDSAGAGSPCVIGAIAGEHCGGEEAWAYVPSMVIPNMWKLADKGYATSHRNFVNGSPITSDICTANCSNANYVATPDTSDDPVWKTILVAGLNGGGRGYYALDITVPGTPTLLWEFTPTTGIGAVQDDDVGYSFGQPIITRKADGTWVVLVTSGYNNTSPGNGKGYLYVLNASTGVIISKIATNVGSTTTPSGLAKIAGWNDEPAGNEAGYVYGGDLLGNVWRFDINSVVAATVADGEIGTGDVMKFAELYSDGAGTSPQPITTTPVLGKIAGKRVIFIGTGKYLETGDLTTTQVQSQYAIKDDNATSTLVNPRNTLVNQTLSNNPDGTATRLTSGNAVNFYTGRGWYIDFPDSGERVNIDSKLVEGTLLVPTIVPSNTVCSPGGYGWLNFFDYKTGGAINTATDLASLKYDSTIVGINVLYVEGAPRVGVVTSTNPTPDINENVEFPATAAGFSGKRVIWRELLQ